MSDYIFDATKYRTKWEVKPFDDTIEDMEPINDEIVAIDVVDKLEGFVLNSHDHLLSYHAPSGLWKFNNSSNLLIHDAIVSGSMENKIYKGFSTESSKPKTIDLGNAPSSERVTKKTCLSLRPTTNFWNLSLSPHYKKLSSEIVCTTCRIYRSSSWYNP